MHYSTLSRSQIDGIMCWFRDPCFNLCEFGISEEEKSYLTSIEEVALRTGAFNLDLADYILQLENRLNKIEESISQWNLRLTK